VLHGAVAFKLYDTYGLDSETIMELAQIESLYFDEAGFEEELNKHKYQSRIGSNKHSAVLAKESLEVLGENYMPKTDDSFKYNYTYDGSSYKFPTLVSKLIGIIINGNIMNKPYENISIIFPSIMNIMYILGELIANKNYPNVTENDDISNRRIINIDRILSSGDEIGIILDKTICYSLEGGQISDKGRIRIKDLLFNIENVKKINDYVIHFGRFAKVPS